MKKKLLSVLLCAAMVGSLAMDADQNNKITQTRIARPSAAFWCHDNAPWVKAYKEMGKKFEKANPDYKSRGCRSIPSKSIMTRFRQH